MSQVLDTDIRDIVLSSGSFGPQEIIKMTSAISADYAQFRELRQAVAELEGRDEQTPASAVRLGVCQYLIGRYRESLATLEKADGSALARFYQAKGKLAQGNYDEAAQFYEAAQKAGYFKDDCALGIVEALRLKLQPQEAMRILDGLSGAVEQTAEYLYQRGATVAALRENLFEAVALYERAIEADPYHTGALFGLALENDRRANDNRAMELYQRATARFPAHVGALLNLGIMYEDRDQHDRAHRCYQRILDAYPTHARARLYIADTEASGEMYYDAESQKKRDRLSQILGIPVSDFELSVRSRNCLQKMGIATLGDLTRASEQELLASKNFGETSLVEIREMMISKGLELGQFAHERAEPEPEIDLSGLSPDEQAILERSIAELNLSVRARKCMVRLGIGTVGELLRRTADELLECKNFGVTSLNEVREKLTIQGLKLRGE